MFTGKPLYIISIDKLICVPKNTEVRCLEGKDLLNDVNICEGIITDVNTDASVLEEMLMFNQCPFTRIDEML